MPATVHPDAVEATLVKVTSSFTDAENLLRTVAPKNIRPRCGEIFQTNFIADDKDRAPRSRYASTDLSEATVVQSSFDNGLVGTILDAYNRHHRVILRPDDIWTAILTQFNVFVNGRAEDLRHLFVAHEGQKHLEIKAVGTRYTVDFGDMAKQMTQKIHENVVDPELREWILPEFSTTSDSDRVIYSVAMMATLQKYFTYQFSLMCGLPSVTLLGERSDWEAIHQRVDKLHAYGPDAEHWATLLKPITQRFIETFDDPRSESIVSFWQTAIQSHSGGSGDPELSGWITAFCYFDRDGKVVGREEPGFIAMGTPPLVIDGISYPFVTMHDVAATTVSVPVLLDDNGQKFDTLMVAGLVGASVKHGQTQPDTDTSLVNDTLQPVAGWWLFEDTKVVVEEEPNPFV